MKTSVTSYSFGEYINPDRLGYLGIIDKAKELGFDGIEYTENYWMDDPDAPQKIKEHCEEVGIEPALFAVARTSSTAPAEIRRRKSPESASSWTLLPLWV